MAQKLSPDGVFEAAGGITVRWLQCGAFYRRHGQILNPATTPEELISPFSPQLPTPEQPLIHWQRLYGSALGLCLAETATTFGPLVVVTTDTRSAQQLEDQIRFFLTPESTLPVHGFPDWECLPYDNFSPHPDIVSQRLRTLYQLPRLRQGIVVVSAPNLMQRLAPTEYVDARAFSMQVGDRIDIDALRSRLHSAGYHAVNQTMSPGEFSVRGSLIDIFPSGSDTPFRLDLLDEQIDSVRYFDPDSQRSGDKIESIELLPAREFPTDEAAIRGFRTAFRRTFAGDPQRYGVYRELSRGHVPPGTEFYLPLFFDRTATFLDYLPERYCLVLVEDVDTALGNVSAEALDRYENASLDSDRAVLHPDQLFLGVEEVTARIERSLRIQIQTFADTPVRHHRSYDTRPGPDVFINPRAPAPYSKLLAFLQEFSGRVLLIAETAGRRENLAGILSEHSLFVDSCRDWRSFLRSSERLGVTVGTLAQGFLTTSPELAILTESELYGERVLQRRRRSTASQDPESIIRSLEELELDDPVVHEDHGVGRYKGLKNLTIDGNQTEFLMLEYYGGDKLYIPVLSLNTVSRFVGASDETAPLHRLGSDAWLRAKRRAKQRAYDIAVELLEIEAVRASRKGHAFPSPDDAYAAFSAEFPFEETPDQLQVIDDVVADMCGDRPMDRLVCGDVGFGKTEVALRAAFLAVQGGKQVAVLVPTTLLAQQHYNNFVDRFAKLPVTVELLSRFRTQKQQNETLKRLMDADIDIVVGTHRVLQRDVRFNRLGLIVIDEEHRFGVRQKEKLKKLRAQTDILTLTATPIPRTLNIALSGLRDISIIATPPKARLSVKTFVREWNDSLVREACMRELRRGGQVYVLHNEVRTIDKMFRALQALLPDTSIQVAHGKLRERELEQIMIDFYHQRCSVLLCSTIIESGIDVPTANTIIINRADRFGLAQLHQLRGRVGRSHHQAFAYMITPPVKSLSADAVKRLQVIESLEDLGAGFALASHDLEIRGAGELLGEAQSGTIDEIGFTMYTEFLNRAISTIRRNGTSSKEYFEADRQQLEINLHVPALFPDDYLPDVHLRLTMYKRLSGVISREQLRELQAEVIDRFGLLPEATKTLFRLTELRFRLAAVDIVRVDLGPQGGRIVFGPSPQIDVTRLIELVQSRPDKYRIADSNTLKIRDDLSDPETRFETLQDLIDELN